jgi:hypothetical protein
MNGFLNSTPDSTPKAHWNKGNLIGQKPPLKLKKI